MPRDNFTFTSLPLTPKVKASPFETLVTTHQITKCHDPVDNMLNITLLCTELIHGSPKFQCPCKPTTVTYSVLVSACPPNNPTVILPIILPQHNHSLSMTQCYHLLDKSEALKRHNTISSSTELDTLSWPIVNWLMCFWELIWLIIYHVLV